MDPQRTGQKRRAPVSSRRYSVWFTVPAKTHCRGHSTTRLPKGGRNRSAVRLMNALMLAISERARLSSSDISTIQQQRPEILIFLLACGFDPNERVSIGEGDWVAYSQGYPLWNCAALGLREIAEILLTRGADPNVHVDSSGSSVHSAYSHKQWEMVDLLRRYGGEVTADTAAIYRESKLIGEMLSSGKADPPETLRFGAMGGHPESVRMALERIDWPRDDPRWFTIATEPLYFWHHIPWLYAGNKDLDRGTYLTCFLLILNRCGPNIRGSFGRTLLHEVAAMRDHITEDEASAFAEALLNAGAKVGFRDDLLKSTALGWAYR